MSILKVARLGHPVLRRTAQPLSPEMLSSGPIQTLIDNMIETMIEYTGVGLAAPQIHESLQLAVIESRGPRGEIPLTVLVNPSFSVLDAAPLQDWEGCLSIPELRGRVPRHSKLRLDSLDRHGKPQQIIAEG